MTSTLDPVHFLLVDDLAENLLSLEVLLQREGVVLLKARSGDEALELLLAHEVALALLDVQMPDMNGFELAEFMRGNERTRHIPIIFVTAGTADSQRRFRGYEAGAVDFIQKPIEADILRSKAEVFFDLHRQRQIVAAQRDELEAATRALQIADRRKDEFLAVLAHELKNPIAAIKAGISLLEKRRGTEQAAAIGEQVDRQLSHLARLVDDLLDVSRITEGKISLKRERIALGDVFASAIEASRPAIDERNHRLAVELPDAPVWLDADLVRMSQVLVNLLGNAAKYTPAGGNITLAAQCAGGVAEIRVVDDGVGIPLDMQGRIFEIFEQVASHRGRAGGGLGIGLSLVRQLVELHGGSITVTSDGEGKGSTFVVRLPLADQSSEPSG